MKNYQKNLIILILSILLVAFFFRQPFVSFLSGNEWIIDEKKISDYDGYIIYSALVIIFLFFSNLKDFAKMILCILCIFVSMIFFLKDPFSSRREFFECFAFLIFISIPIFSAWLISKTILFIKGKIVFLVKEYFPNK